MSLAILFHFLCAQHVSYINISIIRSLRLLCWITTLVVLFLVRCVLEFRCGWVGACNTDTTPNQPHRNSNTHRTKNNTTNVVIQQNSRNLLMVDILMSETCWAHKKWNKISSDIKWVIYSSTIKMMHRSLNIRCTNSWFIISLLYSSTCFEHYCAHHQEVKIVLYGIWYRHTCRWPSHAPDGHLQVWRYQMLYNTMFTSWWWAQQCSKRVEEYNKLIMKQEIVH